MKQHFKYFAVVWAVLLALFNSVTFLVPNELFGITRFDKPLFWITYALVTLTFLGNLALTMKFARSGSGEKLFLNIPLIYVGYGSLAISCAIGAVFMTVPVIPTWIGAIVCIAALGIYALSCVKAIAAADAVAAAGERVKTQSAFIRSITVDAQNLMMRAATDEAKSEVKAVYEALRYSDPMSSPALADEDMAIKSAFGSLREAVSEGNSEKISAAKNELLILIKERNSKCKLFK